MSARSYLVGAPVVITVDNDGRVAICVDLCDVDLTDDSETTLPDDVTVEGAESDNLLFTEAARRTNYTAEAML